MKRCELCDSLAKMYCESDQASLCWDCDAKVHSANFLVAKHSRTLLCHLCQSFTPWTASGPRLGPTVSVCENCVNSREGRGNNDDGQDDDDDDLDREDDTEDDGDDENGDGDDDVGDEDDEENQVVPWTSSPPSPVSSSSNSEECSTRSCNGDQEAYSLKHLRETAEDSAQVPFILIFH